MYNQDQILVAQEIRRKLRNTESAQSATVALTYLSKNQKHTIQSSIFKLLRTLIILAVTATIVALVFAVSTNVFKKRQQEIDGKVDTFTMKEANIQVSQLEFNAVSDEGSKILEVSAVIKNTGNTPGTIGRAKFQAFDQNMTIVSEWPSPLLTEPVYPGEEQTIESSFFEPPDDVFSVELNLERVFSQK